MTDVTVTTAAPAANAPTAAAQPTPSPAVAAVVTAPPAPAVDVAALAAQVAALQQQLAARVAAPVITNPVKLVGMAAVQTWWHTFTAAVTFKNFVACAARTAYDALQGLKTILVFVVTGGLALLSEFQTIDLTPLLSAVLPAGTHIDVAQVVTLMSVVAILLRLVTRTPVFRKAAQSVGGAADSAVDTPSGS